MIKSLYTLSQGIKELYPQYFKPWSDPFSNTEEAYVVVAEVASGKFTHLAPVEPYKEANIDYYLYRKVKGANGTNLVPTFYFYPGKNEKEHQGNVSKLTKKIKASLKNYDHAFLTSEEVDRVGEALINQYTDFDVGQRYLFTMRVDGHWFGEIEEHRQLFEEEAYAKYYEKSSANDKVCAVTYQPVAEVWGRVDTLGFTVNDIAFSRNGFNDADSYKMFPVSPEVVKALEGAKKFAIDNLSRSFYSLKYFILPHFISVIDNKAVKLIIEEFLDNSFKKNTLETEGNAVIANENIIKEIIQSEQLSQQSIYYDIFFYQQNQAQFLIKLHVSDVLPSRFRFIYQVKKDIEARYEVLNRRYYKKKPLPFRVNFYLVAPFFSEKVNNDTVFHPYFFKIVEAIFYGNTLNERILLRAFLPKIRKAFKDPDQRDFEFPRLVKDSWALYHFFVHLNLLNNSAMEKDIRPVDVTVDQFIDQHPLFFQSDYLKGVFYVGCLAKLLIRKQPGEAFYKQLNGLNLDHKTIMKVVPKLYDKIEQYKRIAAEQGGFYADEKRHIDYLESRVAMYITDDQGHNRDEISYAFTVGMIIQNEAILERIRQRKEAKEIPEEI